jgi:hypothetical protein
MVRLSAAEMLREIYIPVSLAKRYAITNYGRLISYTKTIEDGTELKGSHSDGYRTFQYRKMIDGKKKYKTLFICKLVAEYFIPKTSEDQVYVLHLDYTRDNDNVRNLKWATRAEMLEHSRKSPHVIAAKANQRRIDGWKLTSTQVMRLKKILLDPQRKTRIRILAKQFGVSEMQLHRIKTGENWGHIKV